MAVLERNDPTPNLMAINKAALRAADLTRQLLAYAGKGKYLTSEVDLNLLVHETAQICSASLPARVALQCELGEPLPPVSGDATQLFQIIMNLVTNAVEACPPDQDARVTVQTRAEWLDPADLAAATWVLPMTVGPCATLEVTDTGSGIPPEILARIFEPFFSTKFAGRGLGLAALMGVLRSQRGGLQVTSSPGHGSAFKLFLPALPALADACS
jgi:signal transduction histidine kinase